MKDMFGTEMREGDYILRFKGDRGNKVYQQVFQILRFPVEGRVRTRTRIWVGWREQWEPSNLELWDENWTSIVINEEQVENLKSHYRLYAKEEN